MNNSYLVCLVVLATSCYGYRNGPPLTACGDMFPEGHNMDARMDTPPFTFKLNQTTYSPGDVVEISFESAVNPNNPEEWFCEGVLIQMRTLNCDEETAVGQFSVMPDDDFLAPFDCFQKTASAIRHYSHLHVYNKTFYWTAPSQPVGHVYLRGTFARNQAKFWTNVFSDYLRDPTDSTADLKRCPVRTKHTINSAISTTACFFVTVVAMATALIL